MHKPQDTSAPLGADGEAQRPLDGAPRTACPLCEGRGFWRELGGLTHTCPLCQGASEIPPEAIAVVVYRNHRGEVATRRIVPVNIKLMESEHHAGRQWIVPAYDLDRRAMRDFALRDFLGAPTAPPSIERVLADLENAVSLEIEAEGGRPFLAGKIAAINNVRTLLAEHAKDAPAASPSVDVILEIIRTQPFYPGTHTGIRQAWVKEEIAAKIRAAFGEGKVERGDA